MSNPIPGHNPNSLLPVLLGQAESCEVYPGITLHIDGYRLVLDTPRGRKLLGPTERNIDTICELAAREAAPHLDCLRLG